MIARSQHPIRYRDIVVSAAVLRSIEAPLRIFQSAAEISSPHRKGTEACEKIKLVLPLAPSIRKLQPAFAGGTHHAAVTRGIHLRNRERIRDMLPRFQAGEHVTPMIRILG